MHAHGPKAAPSAGFGSPFSAHTPLCTGASASEHDVRATVSASLSRLGPAFSRLVCCESCRSYVLSVVSVVRSSIPKGHMVPAEAVSSAIARVRQRGSYVSRPCLLRDLPFSACPHGNTSHFFAFVFVDFNFGYSTPSNTMPFPV